jgi:hypothetical protein
MPVDVYSELDDDRWEVRKVEVFADGRLQYSDGPHSPFRPGLTITGVSEVPIPPVDENVPEEGLTPSVIGRDTFEDMWERALQPGADQPKR